jgi:hypothetical protein
MSDHDDYADQLINAQRLELTLPRKVIAALRKAAKRHGQGIDAYCAGALLRQVFDDGPDADTIASLIAPDANSNKVLNGRN